MDIMATLDSNKENLIPMQALGPWPNAWKAYLEKKHKNKFDTHYEKSFYWCLADFSSLEKCSG